VPGGNLRADIAIGFRLEWYTLVLVISKADHASTSFEKWKHFSLTGYVVVMVIKEPASTRGLPRRVTAREVAERAGVTVGTVSKALSGRGAVRHETREKILKAARELNYHPSHIAASLLSGRTNTVGVVTSDRFGRLTVPVLLGAIESLAEREIALILCDGRGDPIREQYFVETLLKRRVDGILVTGEGITARDSLGQNLDVPVVYALAKSRSESDISVVPDDGRGARVATRHLLSTGRRRVAFISGLKGDPDVRLEAVREELAIDGLELVHEPLFGQWTERWGRQGAAQLVHSGAIFDGLICGNDQIARAALEVFRDKGINVPGDVGVVGFDNWDVMVEASRPQLSTVDLNLHEVGHVSARALLNLIDAKRVESGVQKVECHLIPRESTAVV
jgi:LacI family transcriptional regulator